MCPEGASGGNRPSPKPRIKARRYPRTSIWLGKPEVGSFIGSPEDIERGSRSRKGSTQRVRGQEKTSFRVGMFSRSSAVRRTQRAQAAIFELAEQFKLGNPTVQNAITAYSSLFRRGRQRDAVIVASVVVAMKGVGDGRRFELLRLLTPKRRKLAQRYVDSLSAKSGEGNFSVVVYANSLAGRLTELLQKKARVPVEDRALEAFRRRIRGMMSGSVESGIDATTKGLSTMIKRTIVVRTVYEEAKRAGLKVNLDDLAGAAGLSRKTVFRSMHEFDMFPKGEPWKA